MLLEAPRQQRLLLGILNPASDLDLVLEAANLVGGRNRLGSSIRRRPEGEGSRSSVVG